jgi:CRP/FNR family transcriptional regulator
MPEASALQTLQKTPLFADLTETELKFLAQRAVRRKFAAGELIFSEGEECPGLWIIESGRVRIFKSSASGREQVLTIEGPGNSVAELPVFDGGTYPASAAPVDSAVVWFVSKQHFHALCLQHPKVPLKVLRVVGRRLRGLVGLIEELSFTTVRSRLASLLLRLAGAAERTPAGLVFTLPANNQELASQIGTVRELVSRNLSRFQAEGLIRMEGRQITIPDRKALEELLAAGE